MDLDTYLADFNTSIAAAAHAEGDYTFNAFLDIVAERLADAQEVVDLIPAHFEGTGKANRNLRLDGVVADEADGSLVLLVGDFRKTQTAARLTTEDAKKQFRAVQYFVEDAVSGRLSQTLEESSEAFRTAQMLRRILPTSNRIRIYLATNALMSEQIKDFPPSMFGNTMVTYHIWDIARFFRAHLAVNGREDIVVDLTKWIEGGMACLPAGSSSDGFQTYLAVIPGAALAAVFAQYGSRLLEGNVRSFLSARGKVNKGMRGTLAQEPQLFLAFNNGLTCTASSVTLAASGDRARIQSITDLQIVNGGQTTASVAAFAREVNSGSLDDVFVQMKLVVVDPAAYDGLVPNIAKFANRQNTVNDADFFANSPFHRRLEELSRRLSVPAAMGSQLETKWFYERARGQYLNEKTKLSSSEARKFEAINPRSQLLTKTDLARYERTWAGKPQDVSLGAQKNFVKFAAVANELWDSHPDDVNEAYFRNMVAKAIVFNSVHKRISQQSWYQSGYLANLTTYSVAKLVELVDKRASGNKIDLSQIWATQGVTDALLRQVDGIAKGVFDVLTSPDRGTQNVTEWAKKDDCWKLVSALPIDLNEDFREQLVDSASLTASRRESRTVQKLDSGIEAQMAVLAIARTVWRAIRDSPDAKLILSPSDHQILRLVTGEINGAIPESYQAQKLLGILEKAKEFGVVPRG